MRGLFFVSSAGAASGAGEAGAGGGASAVRAGDAGGVGVGVAVCAGLRAGWPTSSALGDAVVIRTLAGSVVVVVGAEARTGFPASSIHPPPIPTATAARPPNTMPMFDRSIGCAFLGGCAAIAAVSELCSRATGAALFPSEHPCPPYFSRLVS